MTLGPLEYTVIGFRKGKFDGSIAREIGKVVDEKVIRVVDAVMIDRDAQGNTVIIEIDAKDDPAFESFAPILQNRIALFTPEDVQSLAESLPPETSALAILFEHRWAVDIKEAIRRRRRLPGCPRGHPARGPCGSERRARDCRNSGHGLTRTNNEKEHDMMMRRRGRPLVRAAATTAVVAGTAGAVPHHQQQKYANQDAQQQAEYDAAYQEGPPPRSRPPAPAAPAPSGGTIDMEQLKQLGELHTSGVLSDEEFAAAKAKVLAGG